MPTRDLKDIKIGDRVWVSERYTGERGDLLTVKHLTPTQVHLSGFKNKFQRGTQVKWSKEPSWRGIGFTRGQILSIATPEECAAWDANIAQQQAAMDARKQQAAEAATKRAELTALFPACEEGNRGTQVTDASWGNWDYRAGRYDVTFHGLTESEVRQMATAWNPLPTDSEGQRSKEQEK